MVCKANYRISDAKLTIIANLTNLFPIKKLSRIREIGIRLRRLGINVSSTNFISLYVVEKHVVEEALKERHLKGQSVRAVIQTVFGNEV